MTTDRELLARIDAEIMKMTDFIDSADDIYTAQSVIDEENTHLRFINALRAVVAREEKSNRLGGEAIQAEITGYNQALADVKADIEKALLEKGGE